MSSAGHSAARSRRFRLGAAAVALLLCGLVVAAGAWTLVKERQAALRLALIDSTHLARQVASDAATLALLGDKAAVDANRVAHLHRNDRASVSGELDLEAALVPGLHSAAVFGQNGQRIAMSGQFPGLSEAWRQSTLERHRDGWQDMVISSSAETGVPNTIAVSRSRWSRGRSFEGFAVSLVDLGRLREWAAEQGRAANATVVLMMADGSVVASLGDSGPTRANDTVGLQRLLDAGLGAGVGVGDRSFTTAAAEPDRASLLGVGLARDFPLIGLVEVATETVLADWRRLRDIIVAGTGLIIMAGCLALVVFVRAERRRARAEQDLLVSEERLAAALENGNLSLWDWDVADNHVVFGPRLPILLGYDPDALEHSVEAFQALMHPDDKPRVLSALQAHVEEPEATGAYAVEFRLRRKDGGWTWIADRGRAVEIDEAGRALRVIGVHADITRRKQAEEALQSKSRELEDSNRDLEQFAYIASHDLQEPLRMVSSYLSLMLRREGDRLTDKGRDYAETAADGAKRMGQLIRDLLEYSRVGTRGEEPTTQDTEAILSEAVKNLGIAIAESQASVTVAPGAPPVQGDRSQLVRLVQNLIGNALKYRAPDRAPMIDVRWSAEGDGFVTISVTDNGIGIDPADHDRIFMIFQRLHGRDEYEGTGIGLAVCRRIVERHGGKLWVESNPGAGSTFHAALPRAAEPPREAPVAERPAPAPALAG